LKKYKQNTKEHEKQRREKVRDTLARERKEMVQLQQKLQKLREEKYVEDVGS